MLLKEQIRKRKEDEDRIAAQNEFLRTSLRDSRKLHALESRREAQGADNEAFSVDDDVTVSSSRRESTSRPGTPSSDKELVHAAYGKHCSVYEWLRNELPSGAHTKTSQPEVYLDELVMLF